MSSDEAAATEEGGEVGDQTLGSRLRAARESRELSVEKIADELRIEEEVLLALEEDRLSDIKVAPVFVKGYIKQYGRALNLDYDELRDAWQRQSESEDIRLRPNRAIYLRDERQITIWIVAALIVLLVGVALLLWWLGEGGADVASLSDSSGVESVSVAAPVTSRVEREPPAQADSAPASEVAANAPVVDAPTGVEPIGNDQGSAESPVTDPATVAAAVAAVDEPGDPDVADSISEREDVNPVVVVSPEPEPGSVEMLFDFSAESWFELTDARGRRLHYDLVESGSRLRFMVLPPARVLLGNANAASVSVDAEAFSVPASNLRGNVASIDIDQSLIHI